MAVENRFITITSRVVSISCLFCTITGQYCILLWSRLLLPVLCPHQNPEWDNMPNLFILCCTTRGPVEIFFTAIPCRMSACSPFSASSMAILTVVTTVSFILRSGCAKCSRDSCTFPIQSTPHLTSLP